AAASRRAGPPGATLRHLLTHASGLVYESARTMQPPRLRRHYSNYGPDETARRSERATGRAFAGCGRGRAIDPLGMTGTEWSGSPSVGAVGPIADLALLAAETLRPTLLETRWHREATTAQLPELVGIMPGF